VTRAFGGGDIALLLVRGDDPDVVARAAEAAAEELKTCSSVTSVLTSTPPPPPLDPTEAWRFAGPAARERLARALSPEGMRERLRETRALLLAPGATAAIDLIARDPLRLAMIPWQDQLEMASGVRGAAGDPFVAEGGRVRLVVVEPRGHAFESREARLFTEEAEAALARARRRVPGPILAITGGHVIARETEAMMRTDLTRSGVLSIVLASVVFVITFRRVRALVAVLPPLAAGTLWTTALAALVYPRLSAVAIAFAAVVVGVGVDTGVHVYGHLLHARREGKEPREAAAIARRDTWRPTLGAALAAAGAFACLGLSDIEGMRQLGVLCGAGEVLTAVAILLVVPEVGAMLERGAPPRALEGRWAVALTSTRRRAVVALGIVVAIVLGSLMTGLPKIDHGVAALDARTLPSLATYDQIYAAFGGTRGQVVVVSADSDAARARQRADAVAEAADRLLASGAVTGYDALARLAPSPEVQRARIAERDRLDLPAKRAVLEKALTDEGFDATAFEPALESFSHPSTSTADVIGADSPVVSWLRRRYLAEDPSGQLAVVYVRPAAGADAVVRTTLHAADPSSVITGFHDLELSLARTLEHDLPIVLLGAIALIIVVLAITLRRLPAIGLALVVLFVEIAIVTSISHFLGVKWHVYDALVLPVLLGITLDEVVFLLDAEARSASIEEALAEQAPLGTATALTTAAGFVALCICRFNGLVDVGKVGALGSAVGLVAALVLIPAVARLRLGHKQP
jgi:predicted RND superfamily exporter protein